MHDLRCLCALLLLVPACASDPADAEATSDGSSGESPASTTGDATELRFYEDVAPILAEACVGCHRDGGVAPFALDTYEAASEWADSMIAAVEARTMPPWNVDNAGSCNTYRDARWLADDEIATLRAWVDGGMTEGDARLGMPAPPEPRTLDGDALVSLSTPPSYQPINEAQPEAPADDYQCFLVDPELAADAFIVGYDVHPGNTAIVHHVIGFQIDPDASSPMGGGTNAEVIAALDAASPDQPGWDCFNAAGDGVWVEGVPVTWAPGAGATVLPAGTGVRVPAGHQIVIQMHYHLTGEASPDQTEVELALADSVEREAHAALMDGFLFTLLGTPAELPPGKPDASYTWSVRLRDIPNLGADFDRGEIFGVLPHMHQRGRKMTVDFEIGGETRCGARVPHWDYNWQQAFFYDQAIAVDMDDQMHVRCEWDTTMDDAPVKPGLGTDAEMCLVGVYVAERP